MNVALLWREEVLRAFRTAPWLRKMRAISLIRAQPFFGKYEPQPQDRVAIRQTRRLKP